ncbi:class I SAM-dependent methyltransferase [Roseobacter ponti]|uniref:Class I SAM-dependent methyltransferase n=1 Tax=Roseobacter ponti TaxID=1891787 RepID=A0A858SYE4_9RHOB|nr:class I SAM-dependent methyltransferase [Roseobacter ponti]QJF52882.1 class I SAM-dependent methyltransferase [Roseobacter ponti]
MNETPGRYSEAAVVYDAFAEKYRDYSAGKAAYISSVDNLVCDALINGAGAMLDYGSGDGVRGASVAARTRPAVFFQADVSPEMVARCETLGAAERVFLVDRADWSEDLPPVDTIICLWNVLGHVPGTQVRRELLAELFSLLKPGGRLFIDVNNRHYAGYGRLQSLWRRFVDRISPDYARGDVRFNWQIDGTDYPASGHFFTPAEMRDLLTTAGFDIASSLAVDYTTGAVSADPTQGQLFFEAVRPG